MVATRRFKTGIVLLFAFVVSSGFSQHKLEIRKLTKDFYVFTTYQVFDGEPFPANGLYAVTSKGVVMIDSPWDTTQFQPLLDSIWGRHHQKVVMCIATHSHEDRTGGLAYYRSLGIKTYTTAKTDSICRVRKNHRARFVLKYDTVFSVGGIQFQTYYPGAGHTSDNIVVWFPKSRVLYGGCFVKSVEATSLGNLADAMTTVWPQSIKNVQRKFPNPLFVIPGHQRWDSTDALAHTLKLLANFEVQH